MTTIEILPHLPSYQPPDHVFSATGHGMHTEGLVVRVEPSIGSPWCGNFIRTDGNWDAAFIHPDGEQVIVVAGGQGYLVNPIQPPSVHFFGGFLTQSVTSDAYLVLADNIAVFVFEPAAPMWVSPRLAW